VAKQQLLQHPDHRLSPARRGDEKALQKLVALLRREVLIEAPQVLERQRRSVCSRRLLQAVAL